MYVVELEITHGDDLTCLSAQSESSYFWHRRLGYVSSSLLNKCFLGTRPVVYQSINFVTVKCLMHVSKGNKPDPHLNQIKQVCSSRFLS